MSFLRYVSGQTDTQTCSLQYFTPLQEGGGGKVTSGHKNRPILNTAWNTALNTAWNTALQN